MARRHLLLPAALALLGAGLLAGCIYLPGRDEVLPGERDVRPMVGKEESDRPVRIKHATRDQVLRVLGQPNALTSDGAWIYRWNAQNGGWFQPLCFRTDPAWRIYSMRLEFTDDGRLKRFGVSHTVDEFNPLGVDPPNSHSQANVDPQPMPVTRPQP